MGSLLAGSRLAHPEAAGAGKVFREEAWGANRKRPQPRRLLAPPSPGDAVMVKRLDRPARSTRDLLDVLDTASDGGAVLRSLSDPWTNTTTTDGPLVLKVLARLAGLGCGLIRARTGEGQARARREAGETPAHSCQEPRRALHGHLKALRAKKKHRRLA